MAVSLIPDFLPVPKLVFLQLTGIRTLPSFGGGTFPFAEGQRNPWNAVFYLGVFLLLVFVADASLRLWRRGARRRAAVVGGTIVFFILFAGVHSALVDAGIVRMPYLFSFAYLAIIAAMAIELSDDTLRAAQLSEDLRESEQRMSVAVEGANFGIWIRDLRNGTIWARPAQHFSEDEMGMGIARRKGHPALCFNDRRRVRLLPEQHGGERCAHQADDAEAGDRHALAWIAERLRDHRGDARRRHARHRHDRVKSWRHGVARDT